jgi:hypothetical protein
LPARNAISTIPDPHLGRDPVLYYGSELRRLISPAASAAVKLSARQRECLAWVRQGKSSGMIDEILGSPRHGSKNISRLPARSWASGRAVSGVEACLLGLID